MLAPAKTPRAVVNRLADVIARAVQHPETSRRYTTLGIDPVGNTPEQYTKQVRIDIAKYARAVRQSGVKVD
ncbi:Tripartite tricarboxylate transporter family receptor [compost metagenome]